MIKIKNDAIDFAEWLRTFEPLTKENGYWVLECQISSENLYKAYVHDKSKALKKDTASEQLEHDALLLVCKHENEELMQGDGFTYTICADCGESLD